MSTAIITGSGGLIGAEAVAFFSPAFEAVIGIDNDMRARFFGAEASTAGNSARLEERFANFRHQSLDIRDAEAIDRLFAERGRAVELIIHAAAQPSHDWAVRDPMTDFTVNALGTLVLLEAARRHAPAAVFIFCSTNKVYGDRPNRLPLHQQEGRWEIAADHPYFAHGIDEGMSLDAATHSLFGASKLAADVLVQEYGRNFGLPTGVFRAGCITGPGHAGAELHGFLAYLMKCAVTGRPYSVFGYRGKQVRDNLHSADLIAAFASFARAPRAGEVYNVGGGRASDCSLLEAIALCEEIAGRRLDWRYEKAHRTGDHIWWISDTRKFRSHYPDWAPRYDVPAILEDIHARNQERWLTETAAAG